MDDYSLSIRSSDSDRQLVFSRPSLDSFVVAVEGHGAQAQLSVSAYTDPKGMCRFLERIAAYQRPWAGAEFWASLEGEFSIAATCTSSGAVRFSVSLSGQPGTCEEWQLAVNIASELGQLPALASGARRFFAEVAGT